MTGSGTASRRRAPLALALVVGLAVGLVVAGCGRGGGPKVAAEVEGRSISAQRTEQLASTLAKGDAMRDEVEQGELSRRGVNQVVLAYLIRLTFLEHLAEKMGVADAADSRERQAVTQLPADAFTARGWTANDLQAALKATRLSKALAQKVFPSPGVSEKDLRDYYEHHADEFRNYWHAEARVAFFRAEDPARKLRQEVQGGQPFPAAAHALGAEQEGSLGEVTPDAPLGPPIIAAIAALRPGQVGDPVAAGGGWFVVAVNQRVDTPARSFEDAQPELRKLQEDDRRQDLFYEWLGKQLARAKVKVSRHYGRWNPQTLEVM
ncbi:MAG TPA: peptidyl-prolyl cis-trans isomerase [Acidimicrobiia bacterium]